MAIVYEDADVAGPVTHVLVIGIGHYPHLPGGGAEPARLDAQMRQLSSPPVSARAFADWVIARFDNPGRPLASVELLLGSDDRDYRPPPRGGVELPPVAATPATLQNISAAAVRWKQRGDDDPGNLLLFYFCGHGLSKGGEFAIVASDYGHSQGRPLDGLVDVQKFFGGMQDCRATDQCYFIDACRASDESLVDTADYGHSLVQKLGVQTPGLKQCVYYSTLGGERAHARRQQPSFYTQALIQALNGAGAANTRGSWWINTTRLFEALGHRMQDLSDASLPTVLVPHSGSQITYDFHRISGLPELPFLVAIDEHQGPEAPESVRSLVFEQGGAGIARYPPGEPPLARSCEWQLRYFETWLEPGMTVLIRDKDHAGLRTEQHYLGPPGLTLEGW